MEESKGKDKNKGTRKTVYFGDDENYLLDYALKQSKNFAPYIKKLIEKDMQKEPLETTVIEIVENYLNTKKISVNATEQPKEIDYNEDDLNALDALMNKK